MNARPAARFASSPASWNRSSQADSADGEGTARPRPRRKRLFISRRSRRTNNRRSTARRTAAKPASRLETLQVLDPIAAAQIERDHRDDHLHVQPALSTRHPQVPPDRRRQSRHLDQIQVNPKPGKTRQLAAAWLRFVLERKSALCHPTFTPLVMLFFRKPIMNPLGFKANGVLRSLLVQDQGHASKEASLCLAHRPVI
jgi:hypothetical protein